MHVKKHKTVRRKTTRRRRTVKKNRKGGAVLGDGIHGHVIYPGILCKGKDPTTYVTKVLPEGEMNQDYDEKKMKDISAILKQIDPEQKYFIYPDFCDTEIGPLTKENEKDIQGSFKSYNMVKGEVSFADKWKQRQGFWNIYNAIIDENNNDNKLALQNKYRSTIRTYLDSVTEDTTHLLKGLKKLHDAGILHNDIQSGNILYMKNGKPRIIDFEESELKRPTKQEQEKEIQKLIDTVTRLGLRDAYPDLYQMFTEKVFT